VTFEFVPDDKGEHLGTYLKRIRQGKELSLSDVASVLRIHEKYLAAIEEGDDTLFPDRIFKELFIKAYSDYLGVSVDDLLLRVPEATPPATTGEAAKPAARVSKAAEPVAKPIPINIYREEESRRSGGKSILVAGLVIVIIVLGFFLVKLTFDNHPPAKVVIPQAIPKSIPKKPAVDSTAMLADSLDTNRTSDSTVAVDTVGESEPQDSVLLLIVGKGRSWMRVRRDGDTTLSDEMIHTNDTLWLGLQDSIYLRFGRANAVDLFLNALPLKIARGDDTTVMSLWISRDNYLKYVDSSRLAP
jgi:transcriptional regulator with XRE-family HTH domain